uniref:CHASE4 domain-containing protein n=1 Tax=Novosphingobium sp. TaxID=1874826 RepID=UPI0025DD9614
MLTKLASGWRNLALGLKFNLVFLLVGLAALAGGGWMLDRAVSPAFEQLEQQAAQDQYARAGEVLATAVKFAEDSTTDYSVWDDSFDYIQDNNADFVQVNAPVTGLVHAGVNIMAYARYDGQPRLVRYVDLATGKQDEGRSLTIARLVQDPAIRARVQRSGQLSGFLKIDGRILSVALVPIVRSDE